jgi:hypothetical protein
MAYRQVTSVTWQYFVARLSVWVASFFNGLKGIVYSAQLLCKIFFNSGQLRVFFIQSKAFLDSAQEINSKKFKRLSK